MEQLDDVRRELARPGNRFRSAPFWAWNDRLDSQELIRQLRLMKGQGIGGVFIHSREGLETEYLSDEWMARVKDTLEEARSLGMEAWIYDEDKWPSGSAGGKVSQADPERFTARGLTAELVPVGSDYPDAGSEVVGVYRIIREESSSGRLQSWEKRRPETSSSAPGELLVLRSEISGPSEWYNGSAPTDVLNPDAVEAFLNLTHERYAGDFSADFGAVIRGFFTDEPNFCDFFSSFTQGRPWLPWTGGLPQAFREARGYDIGDILPLLFFHGAGEGKARHDFWLTLTELFLDSYTRRLFEWCDDRSLELTGHMLYENDLGYSTRVSGASMPHYRYMHAPGIDILGDQTQEYLTVKQCTSVANQFRRSTVLTETYGCTGWDFSFRDQKALGDWQFVMGVNRRCHHLALYSLAGCRKRDYPPSFNYNSTWWKHSRILEEYFARLSVCVSSGRVAREILVIHPMSSIWMESGCSMDEDLSRIHMNMGWQDGHITAGNRRGDEYNRLARTLLMSQFDFDFGDELILRDSAGVRGRRLVVAEHEYGVIVVPRLLSLMSSTVELLAEFSAHGGKVVWVQPMPDCIDGEPSAALETLRVPGRTTEVPGYEELPEVLARLVERPLLVAGEDGRSADGILTMVRILSGGRVVTVVNTDRNRKLSLRLHFRFRGGLTVYDPLSGNPEAACSPSPSSRMPEGMSLPLELEGGGCRVFFIDTGTEPVLRDTPPVYRHPHDTDGVIYGLPRQTEAAASMENALVLDRCRFSVGDEPPWEESLVWQGQRRLREHLGMPPVYYNGAPQRYLWAVEDPPGRTSPVRLEFSFEVLQLPEGPVYAVVEKSDDFTVRCNGRSAELTDGTYLDHSMRKHRIEGLCKGINVLEVLVPYRLSTELEDLFLVGDFGVDNRRRLVSAPRYLKFGDWCFQGYPHYPGSIVYRFPLPPLELESGREYFLQTGTFLGTLAVMRVNGGADRPVLCSGERLPLTDELHSGAGNVVELEVVGSPRNLLGPLHRAFSPCTRISWADFRTEGANHTVACSLVPQGLDGEWAVVAD